MATYSDIKLNPLTLDIDLTNGSITIIEDIDVVRQALSLRLNTFLRDWVLNTVDYGIDYRRAILVKNPNLQIIRSLFEAQILATVGVESIEQMKLSFDKTLRSLTLECRIVTTFGRLEAQAVPSFGFARSYICRNGLTSFADLLEERGFSPLAALIREQGYDFFQTIQDVEEYSDLAEIEEPVDFGSLYASLWVVSTPVY